MFKRALALILEEYIASIMSETEQFSIFEVRCFYYGQYITFRYGDCFDI